MDIFQRKILIFHEKASSNHVDRVYLGYKVLYACAESVCRLRQGAP